MQTRSGFCDLSEEFPGDIREARVVRLDVGLDSINMYGIPPEKFRIMWMALFGTVSRCSVCALVKETIGHIILRPSSSVRKSVSIRIPQGPLIL